METTNALIAVGTLVSAMAAVASFIWTVRIHREVRTPEGTTLAAEVESIGKDPS